MPKKPPRVPGSKRRVTVTPAEDPPERIRAGRLEAVGYMIAWLDMRAAEDAGDHEAASRHQIAMQDMVLASVLSTGLVPNLAGLCEVLGVHVHGSRDGLRAWFGGETAEGRGA